VTGPWDILETTEYATWFAGLTEKQQAAIRERVVQLEDHGPLLNRPLADRVSSSRHHNMKELRISSSGAIRILFAFDDARRAVLLLGGIKSEENKWNAWYAESVPLADEIMDRHMGEMRRRHGN